MLKNVSAKLVELPNIKEVEEDILLGGFFSILVTEY
jgi:hypothetical protein